MLDRIDIHIEVPGLSVEEIIGRGPSGESSAEMREKVIAAYQIQLERYQNEEFTHNSQLGGKALERYCQVDFEGQVILKNAIERLALSARAYDRILRLSRTIADLEGSEGIKTNHVAEAVQYRSLDRKLR